jgi:hypothetical protein
MITSLARQPDLEPSPVISEGPDEGYPRRIGQTIPADIWRATATFRDLLDAPALCQALIP